MVSTAPHGRSAMLPGLATICSARKMACSLAASAFRARPRKLRATHNRSAHLFERAMPLPYSKTVHQSGYENHIFPTDQNDAPLRAKAAIPVQT